MGIEYTAIITQEEDWWLGWIEEIPGVNAQEMSKEELLISLKEAAKDILELRRQQARNEIKNDFQILNCTALSAGDIQYAIANVTIS